ncbi:MAG: hypothetical protein QOF98_987, partial [Streptomyces sp.]|nr:hypothetical protein [Streptomyces sp.]
MTDETEVLVVGAGPTGLTTAAGLLQRGVRVRVIDKAERANPHSKAIVLWPRAMEAFDSLGVGEDVFAAGVKIHGTNNYTGGRRVGGFRMKPLTGTRFPLAVSLPQSLTERFLRDAVERLGGRIEFGRRLETLQQEDDVVVAKLDDGETIRASWVVGADGAYSKVRDETGVSFEGSPYPQTFVLVDGEYDTDCRHDESYYMLGPGGVVVVVGL